MRRLTFLLLAFLSLPQAWADQAEAGRPVLDESKPVPPKSEVVKSWRKRQDAVRTLRFAWTETQTHPVGWIPNPRVPERERLAVPALFSDRNRTVSKTLTVDGQKMRYSFEVDRKEEPDGAAVKSPTGDNQGLGERRHYSYVSVFDGQAGTTRLSAVGEGLPAVVTRITANVDAQNLDTRPILMALRPLDPVMGHTLLDRAITNLVRIFYKGRSTMLLEEQRDASGWKTLMWLEPERDFIVTRYIVLFEQRIMVDVDVDYVTDPRAGWVPGAWRVTEKLTDGTKRVLSTAKVTSYAINEPVAAAQFQ
jgi:hypothetical protein